MGLEDCFHSLFLPQLFFSSDFSLQEIVEQKWENKKDVKQTNKQKQH